MKHVDLLVLCVRRSVGVLALAKTYGPRVDDAATDFGGGDSPVNGRYW
jgi:hypothetical protein